jgi:hypothetical protein
MPRLLNFSRDAQEAQAPAQEAVPDGLSDGQQETHSHSDSTSKPQVSSLPTRAVTERPPGKAIGFFELARGRDTPATVDVVAVHGLGGHAFKTWEHEDGPLWMEDFLPDDVPFARILTFGYDSTVAFSKSVARIEDTALKLLNGLYTERENDKAVQVNRPIVFVCHSMGGIVVKKALILAHERLSDGAFSDILFNTRAIAFLSVPHQGSKTAGWATIVAAALKGASLGTFTNTAMISDLKRDSTTLSNISAQFVHRAKDLTIYTFYETKKLYGACVCWLSIDKNES